MKNQNFFTAKDAKNLRKKRKELNLSHFFFANFATSLRLCGKKTLFGMTTLVKTRFYLVLPMLTGSTCRNRRHEVEPRTNERPSLRDWLNATPNIKFTLIIFISFFISCNTNNSNFQNNQQFADSLFANHIEMLNYHFLSSSGLNIEKVIDFEKRINSADVTNDYAVEIGECLYPNKKGYKLEKSIESQRIEYPYFRVGVSYYYTEKDNLVRVVLFDWNFISRERDNIVIESIDYRTKDKVAREKFSEIEDVLTSFLGNPTYKEIESEKGEKNFRDDIKWLNKGKGTLKAYLMMFSDYSIRLVIYKE